MIVHIFNSEKNDLVISGALTTSFDFSMSRLYREAEPCLWLDTGEKIGVIALLIEADDNFD